MDIYNDSDLPALSFRQIRAGDAANMACVTVKATCSIHQGLMATLADVQEPVLFEDVYDGDPQTTTLLRTTDLIPYKPAADITLLAHAYAQTAADEAGFIAGLILGDKVCRFAVHPPVALLRESGQLRRVTKPMPHATPISWTHSYGGPIEPRQGDTPPDVVRQNPVGTGALPPEQLLEGEYLWRPTITDPDAQNGFATSWGAAPVSPWWRGRQQFAGTYDKDWLNEIHPRLPDDFDYRFYQYAAPALIKENYLQGGEFLRLINLHPELPVIDTWLPKWRPVAWVRRRSNEVSAMHLNLDGCHIRMIDGPPHMVLTWRAWIAEADIVDAFQIRIEGLNELITQRAAVRAALV